MTRQEAAQFAREHLDKHGLKDWGIRVNANLRNNTVLALCVYKDKCIILNAHHIDIHPDHEVKNTILHEIAHALMPGHQHNQHWANKARELGCINTMPCSNLGLPSDIIDAIRSGADLEVTFETQVITTPSYKVTRLQDHCSTCGKVAKELKNWTVEILDESQPNLKFIQLECGHLEVKKVPKGTPFHRMVSNDWKPEVSNCQHDWNENQCNNCQQYKPFPFQLDGMRFAEAALVSNRGAIIADDMGLGKTIQALGLIKYTPSLLPVLFIVKSGLKYQLFSEIFRWLGVDYVPQIIETSNDYLLPQMNTYVVGYDMLVPKTRKSKNGKLITQGFDTQKFVDRGIKLIILDECQHIKNPDATRTQQVRILAKKTGAAILPLSGTPWKNRGSEIFTVCNLVNPTKFWSQQEFIRRWVEIEYDGKYSRERGIRNPERFREYTKDMLIRRELEEVMPQLPKVNRTILNIELDQFNQQTYNNELSDFVRWYNERLIDGDEHSFESQTNILARLARLRHITGLAKIGATMEFIEAFFEETTDRKITIFVHHVDVGKAIKYECEKEFPDVPVYQLTSELSSEERFELQKKFNETPRCILIASTLASGEGLNLQSCADCIMHERQWNPANEDQAAPGRFRRIGQTKPVNIKFVIATGTVDDILTRIIEGKRVAFHKSHNKLEMPQWDQVNIVKELVDGLVRQFESGKRVKAMLA